MLSFVLEGSHVCGLAISIRWDIGGLGLVLDEMEDCNADYIL
jgi:hypothetical protein